MAEDFYQEVDTKEGKQLWVKDKEMAHDLANMEDLLRAREQELKRQVETGMTESERKMIAFNKGLVAQFPHAFKTEIGPDGKEYHEVKPITMKNGEPNRRYRRILTDKGILKVTVPDVGEPRQSEDFLQRVSEIGAGKLAVAFDASLEGGLKALVDSRDKVEEANPDLGLGNKYDPFIVSMSSPFSELTGRNRANLDDFKDVLVMVEKQQKEIAETVTKAPDVEAALKMFE